ncbi:hypothetical protein CWC22_004245 [Pseudoalteromonas rubra]|uniref:Uncharacterized protein n=1 Tax=Pseudoalteromonas rubra TaxID=43658 RepID=A0A5S3UQ51_9GAMM|nr:hypothetical protein [Pseudoalteromonas rubra]QPB82253.1 hypothetical protein CWC22_004245 [Pseudoalteromonas rubra]
MPVNISEKQWNDAIQNSEAGPDLIYAKSVFFNQPERKIITRFQINFIERTDELRFMPANLMMAYLPYFVRFIVTCRHDEFDKSAIANCFFSLLEGKLSDDTINTIELLHKSKDALLFISNRLDEFNTDPDIYGNLQPRLHHLITLLDQKA